MRAYNTLKEWMKKDIVNVPERIFQNKLFVEELAKATSPKAYEKLMEKFGINFILTAPQARKILMKEKTNISTILLVTSAGR